MRRESLSQQMPGLCWACQESEGWDLSPARRHDSAPGTVCRQALCTHLAFLFRRSAPCTRTHVVAHESPWMTNMWMKFFIPHPSVRMHVSRVQTQPQTKIVSLTEFTLQCAFSEAHFSKCFHQLLSAAILGEQRGLSKTSNFANPGAAGWVMPLSAVSGSRRL